MLMKKLLFIQNNDSSDNLLMAHELSPFLLMDYPGEITPIQNEKKIISKKIRLLKDLEIITIVYSCEHENPNKIYAQNELTPGDIKWMDGSSGLLHVESDIIDDEKIVQLWINLPQTDTLSINYKEFILNHTPVFQLDNNSGKLKVIVGEYSGKSGLYTTTTPINIWDMRLNSGHTFNFKVPDGHTSAIFVLSGSIILSDGHEIKEAELGVLERTGDMFSFTTMERTKLLFLGGEPINEAVIGHAMFKLNAPQEILNEYRNR